MRALALCAERLTSWSVRVLGPGPIDRFPARFSPCQRPQRAVRLKNRTDRQRQLAPPDHVGDVAERADHRDAGSLLGIRERVRLHRHAHAEDRRQDLGTEQRLVALIVGVRHERHARRNQLRTRRLDLDESAVGSGEANPVIGARLLAIFELGLGDRRPEVDVPESRRFELIRDPPSQQAEKGELRHALRPAIDRRVGQRPVHGQSERSPEIFEDLLVLGRQPGAELDEVRARHGDWLLAGLVRRRERGVVGKRRIAPHTEVVLHAPLGREAVVVPTHRIEHRLAAHPLKASDDIGVRVGEDVADVERAADRRGRRIDREDLRARPAAIEPVDALGLPPGRPFLLEPFEGGLVRD